MDGDPITLEQVRERAQTAGLSPRDALARLIDERVLAHYAQRRGYHNLGVVEREGKRAAVRALLETAVEEQVTPQGVAADAVRQRFEVVRKRKAATGEGPVFEQVEGAIRKQLALEGRRARLAQLLEELGQQIEVVEHRAAIDRALADSQLWSGSM